MAGQAKTFKQGQDWFVRLPDGRILNLNSSDGAAFVLGLLERDKIKPKRGKPGPSETKSR